MPERLIKASYFSEIKMSCRIVANCKVITEQDDSHHFAKMVTCAQYQPIIRKLLFLVQNLFWLWVSLYGVIYELGWIVFLIMIMLALWFGYQWVPDS